MYVRTQDIQAFEELVLCAEMTVVNGETLQGSSAISDVDGFIGFVTNLQHLLHTNSIHMQNHVRDHSKICITLYTIMLPS